MKLTPALSTAVRAVGAQLVHHGLKLVLAESITGGAVAAAIASDECAGDYFLGSFACYADEFKMQVLGVDKSLLDEFGGVSPEVTAALVEGMEKRVQDGDVFVAVTGFAFESAATSKEKPVGTVYVHIKIKNADSNANEDQASNAKEFRKRYLFSGDAQAIKEQTIAVIVDEISAQLKDGRS